MGMQSTWVWWTERSAVWISYFDVGKSNATAFSSPDDATKDVHIFYYKKADPFKKEGDSVPDRSVLSNTYLGIATTGSAGSYLVGTSFINQESEVPEQFHQILVEKAIQLGYEKSPEGLQFATYFAQKFEQGVKRGKQFATRGRTNRPVFITPADF
jgi:hypothetical protein